MKRKSNKDSLPFVNSVVLYDKSELHDFISVFIQMDLTNDEPLQLFVRALNDGYKNNAFDNLPQETEKRKEKIIQTVVSRINSVRSDKLREEFFDWFNKGLELDSDIELAKELFNRYRWDDLMDKMQKLNDNPDVKFEDKITKLKPIPTQANKKNICPLSEVEIPDEKDEVVFPTGIEELDDKVKMRQSNFVVVAARASVGKSLFMLNHALYLAKNGISAIYVSLEESSIEIKKRVMNSIGAQINTNPEAIEKNNDIMNRLFICTPSSSSPDTIFNEILDYKREHPVDVIFIDYMQLMKYPDIKNDFDSLRALTRSLKLFAIQNNVLLVSASQIRRDAEYTGANLASLYGSATIEADANVVILIEPIRQQNVRINNTTPISIKIAKNRSGAQGEITNLCIEYDKGTIVSS